MRCRNFFKLLSCLAVFFMLVFAFPVSSSVSAITNATVSVSPATQTIGPDEQFTVSIVVEPNNAIAGMQFDLSFDPSLVTASEVTEGNLLSQGGASTYFNTGQFDNEAGTVTGVFGVIITPGATVSSGGVFATITMTSGTTQEGICQLTLSNVVIGDVNGQSVPVNVSGGEVIININEAPVLNAIGSKSVSEGQILQFTISASDGDGDALTYSVSNLPQGATFNPDTRVFFWQPGYDQSGTYANIRFEVSDGVLTDSEDITITVNGVNEPYDISNDGAVNVLDIIVVAQQWGATGSNGWISEDINVDGVVNVLDVVLIGQHWTT